MSPHARPPATPDRSAVRPGPDDVRVAPDLPAPAVAPPVGTSGGSPAPGRPTARPDVHRAGRPTSQDDVLKAGDHRRGRRRPFRYRHAGLLAVGAGSVLWGTTGVVVRQVHAATGLSAAAIGCYRLALAAVVLGAVRSRRLPVIARAALRSPWLLLGSGAGLGAYQALYFLGVQEAGVGVATLVSVGSAPVVTTAAGALRRRRVPEPAAVLVLVTALAGLTLVSLPSATSGSGSGRPLLGVLASTGSGVGYGLTVLLNRRWAARVDPVTMTVGSSAVGAAVLVPVAVAGGPVAVGGAAPLAGLVYLGVVCTALAYGLFYAGLRTTAGEVAVVVTLLEPLTAAVLAVVLLGEPLGVATVLGGLLMLGAIVLLAVRSPR